MTTLEDLIGQTLVFGIPGTRVRPEDVALFRETRAGGLILYRINFESPGQVKRLITDLESALGRRLLVTVDHEGGRVIMFRDGVTVFPDSLAAGTGGRIQDVRRQGEIEARELRRLGVDVNFSPVADVLTKTHSPNIGIRSYGKDPGLVSAMAAARIQGMQENGVSACAKHFPGLGPASLDPHLDLPVIRLSWNELRRAHLSPFYKAMEVGVDMVMSSHPLYPRLDPSPRTPATFSARLMTDLLRGEMGFQGVVSSDDLEMGALRNLCSVGRAAVLAAKAGHDLLLCCHKAPMQRRVFQELLKAYKSGELPLASLEKSAERIRSLKAKRKDRFSEGPPLPEPEGGALALDMARRGVQHWKKGRPGFPLPIRQGSVAVVFPQLSSFTKRIMVETALEKESDFLLAQLRPLAIEPRVHITPVDPKEKQIATAARLARVADTTVFFCFDAHLYPGCGRLLRALQKNSKRLAVVLLRNPYDLAFARPGTHVVTAFGWRVCQIRACMEKVFGI